MCLGNPIHRDLSDPPDVFTPAYQKVYKEHLAKLAIRSQQPHDPMTPENAFSAIVWVPYYHDFFFCLMSGSLIFGSTLLIMSPMDFLKKPSAWVCAMDRYGGIDTAHATIKHKFASAFASSHLPTQRDSLTQRHTTPHFHTHASNAQAHADVTAGTTASSRVARTSPSNTSSHTPQQRRWRTSKNVQSMSSLAVSQRGCTL